MTRLMLYPILSACTILSFLFSVAQKPHYPNTLLWRISGKGLQKSFYLFGTMHLQDRRIFQFTDSLYYFLEHAEGYAMEIDPDDAMAALIKGLRDEDTSGYLKDEMNETEFKEIADDLENRFGVPADKITKKQAWLYQQGGSRGKRKPNDMDVAVDMYLYNIAKRQGKWVGGIEDVEDQLSMMETLGREFNASDLLLGAKKGRADAEKLIQLYAAQDLNAIDECINSMEAQQRELLLTRRNRKIAHRIDSMAHLRNYFFAVGAGHLPGQDGLLHLLTHSGYHVEPVVSKRKIDPQNYRYTEVELPWYPTENEEKTYRVEMPGKSIVFVPKGNELKMDMYADLGTGIMYFITGFPVSEGKNKDSVLMAFIQRFSQTMEGRPAKIRHKGQEGYEFINRSNGYYYRVRLFVNGGRMVMASTGSLKKDLLYHKEAERYYQSLEMKQPAEAKKASPNWFQYTDELRAFGVEFPGKPSVNKELTAEMDKKDQTEAWNFDNQTYVDLARQVYYMVVIKETKPGYYILNDREFLEQVKQSVEGNYTAITRYDTGYFKGLPCMWLDGDYKDGLIMKSLHLNKGNRGYALAVVFQKGNSDTAGIGRFFQSFSLGEFKKADWKEASDPNRSFSTIAPAPFQLLEKDGTEEAGSAMDGYSLLSQHPYSNFSFQVDVEAIPDYYWISNDSSFFAGKSVQYIGSTDSLHSFKTVTNGKATGMEYLIGMGEDGRNIKRIRIFRNGDSTYTLSLIAPKAYIQNREYELFFSSFRFADYAPNGSIFQNKARRLLADLTSSDSAVFNRASSYLEQAPFTKADLPYLHGAMLELYQDFDAEEFCTNDQVLNTVIDLKDESTIDFIRHNYALLKDEKEQLKYPLLRVLAHHKTAKSYSLLKELLVKEAPASGNPLGLAGVLLDSMALAQSLYPEILSLSSNPVFSDVLVKLNERLLDTGMITLDDLAPFRQNLLAQAKDKFEAVQRSGQKEVWEYYDWIYLLGRFNDGESNKLLQSIARSRFVELNYQSVLELVKNKQPVDPSVLEKVAADPYYRFSLYHTLNELQKPALFPSKFRNQKSIAQSELFQYASDEMDPQSVDFLGIRTTIFMGEQKKFYLFRVLYSYEDDTSETYLGVVGPFSPDSREIQTNTNATGLSAEMFDASSVNVQFTKYLQETEAFLKQSAASKE